MSRITDAPEISPALSDGQVNEMARTILECVTAFFAVPENVRDFEAWQRERENDDVQKNA